MQVREICGNIAEMRGSPSRERSIDREHIVPHRAITQRTGAAGIIAGHSADRRAGGRRYVDRKPEPVRFELAIEIVEHDAGLDDAAPAHDVEREDAAKIFGSVD